jgi:hypothetical protein
MTMKFATIAIQDFASITVIGRVEHGGGCEALDLSGTGLRRIFRKFEAALPNNQAYQPGFLGKRVQEPWGRSEFG